MSAENGKVCCNCRHNKRTPKQDYIECRCDIDNHYIGYVECMEGWCRRWAREKRTESGGGVNDAMDAYTIDFDDYDIDMCQ